MKFSLSLFGLAFFVITHLVATPALLARSSQTTAEENNRKKRPSVAITFKDGSSLTSSAEGGISDLVGLEPHEVVSLKLSFPSTAAGQRIIVQSLDGGFASGTTNIAGADGTLDVTFQAGSSPGLNRVLIINQGTSAVIRFWVINNSQPTANPPQMR